VSRVVFYLSGLVFVPPLIPVDNWSQDAKGKFPEKLKPLVSRAAIAAMHNEMLHERDEERPFFAAMPSALPYNQYTLTVSPLPAPIRVVGLLQYYCERQE
jgi:hypothetical protein